MQFNEEEEKLITEAVSKLCIWEGHEDCLECQDCYKFADDDCNLYDVIMDIFEKAKKQTIREILEEIASGHNIQELAEKYGAVKDEK